MHRYFTKKKIPILWNTILYSAMTHDILNSPIVLLLLLRLLNITILRYRKSRISVIISIKTQCILPYHCHAIGISCRFSLKEIFPHESDSRNSSETAPDVIFVPDWRTEVTCLGVRRKLNTRPVPGRPISVERTLALADRHTVPRRVSRAAIIGRWTSCYGS